MCNFCHCGSLNQNKTKDLSRVGSWEFGQFGWVYSLADENLSHITHGLRSSQFNSHSHWVEVKLLKCNLGFFL